jgi:hypothetical protein
VRVSLRSSSRGSGSAAGCSFRCSCIDSCRLARVKIYGLDFTSATNARKPLVAVECTPGREEFIRDPKADALDSVASVAWAYAKRDEGWVPEPQPLAKDG